MVTIRRVSLILVLFLAAMGAGGQETFEGLATVGSFGRFPSGLFGASNLVPANTVVVVRNLDTGRSERIIITDSVGEAGIFLVLSPEAAHALELNPTGGTRVRLTEVVVSSIPGPAALEDRAFSPDPDINPRAAIDSLLASIPPADVDEETVQGPDPDDTTQSLPDADAEPEQVTDEEPAAEPDEAPDTEIEVATQPEPKPQEEKPEEEKPEPQPDLGLETEPKPEPVKPEETPPEVASEPVARRGIAAGIARTSVGQAQESFERPDTALETTQPEPDPEPVVENPSEPVLVQAEPGAETSVAAEEPAARSVDSVVSDEPQAPVVEFADRPARPQQPDEITIADEPSVAPESDRDSAASIDGPIDRAIREATERLPAKDVYPGPTGQGGDIGFAAATRPSPQRVATALPEADAPAIERPSLAGLAPLQADATPIDAALAEAIAPEQETPDVTAIAGRNAPDSPVSVSSLPSAQTFEEERPREEGLVRLEAGSVAAPEGPFASAAAPDEERPTVEGLARIQAGTPAPPAGPFATASVPAEEAARDETIAVRTAPESEVSVSSLPEATTAEDARPALDQLARAEAGEVPAPDGPLVSALPPEEETASEESVGPVEPPAGAVGDADLAEARPASEDEGAEVEVADESSVRPEDIPEDAVLALEPADFRPPETPDPDEESLLDRADPGEPEEPVLADAPEPDDRPAESEPEVEVAQAEPEPTSDVESEEPARAEPETETETADGPAEPETGTQPTRVVSAPEGLPLVETLQDERFYLQIGAYTNAQTAQVAVNALATTYPMAVYPISRETSTVYRVMVGPLERDETGTLLLWLRSRGYRDAFIRDGSES